MIQVNNISQSFPDQVLFENISFNIQAGERCGLIGRNGSGKSTIFSLILNEKQPDSGEISIPKGYKISSLEQHINFTKDTVLEECTQVLEGESKYDFHKAEKILSGLGFSEEDFSKSPNSFSGGYQIRINLCKALLTEPNLLLLDEPTNYLDILSLRWLRSFLNSFKGEVIIITHDKDFMNSVTTHTMGIYRKTLKKIKGSTNKFYEQLRLEDEIYEKTRENNEKKRAHLESFVERFSAKASKATQAQSKQKQLDKMQQMDQLESDSLMRIHFQYEDFSAKTLMDFENISFGHTKDNLLFKDLSFSINKKDRIGIIGKNGKGKSTLLNVIANELEPIQGKINSHQSVRKGHFGQTNVDRLTNSNTIIEEIQAENSALENTAVRNICGSLMFEGDLAQKKISVLSGGERNRVLLGKIIANKTNLLLLDEPTNHLDMESIEQLKNELKAYKGSVIIVTHNESFLREICDKLIIFHKNKAEVFDGGYNEFIEKIGWEEEQKGTRSKKQSGLSKKEIHTKRSAIIKERSKRCNPIKKEIEIIEEEIIKAEERLEVYNKDIIEATEKLDDKKILECSMQIGLIEKEIQDYFISLEKKEEDLQKESTYFDEQLEELE